VSVVLIVATIWLSLCWMHTKCHLLTRRVCGLDLKLLLGHHLPHPLLKCTPTCPGTRLDRPVPDVYRQAFLSELQSADRHCGISWLLVSEPTSPAANHSTVFEKLKNSSSLLNSKSEDMLQFSKPSQSPLKKFIRLKKLLVARQQTHSGTSIGLAD